MNLLFGEQRLGVCGQLERVAPYDVDGSSGFSGAVLYLGGATKFNCDGSAHASLQPYIGKPVTLVGVCKVAGEKGQRGELKIAKLLQAWHNGQQIYGSADSAVVADVSRATVPMAARRVA